MRQTSCSLRKVLLKEQKSINDQVSAASQREIDISSLESQKSVAVKALRAASSKKVDLEQRVSLLSCQVEDLSLQLQTMAPLAESSSTKLEAVEIHKQQMAEARANIEKMERQEKNLQSKIDLLHDHEYDPDCEYCRNNEFVKQAEDAKEKIFKLSEGQRK